MVFAGTEKAVLKNPLVRNIITIPRKGKGIRQVFSFFRSYDLAVATNVSDRTVIMASLAGKRSIGIVQGFQSHWWKRFILNDHCVYNDQFHVVTSMLSLAGKIGISPIPEVTMGFDGDDLEFVRGNIPVERYLLLHPYSMKRCKYWPAERWGKLAGLIHEYLDCAVVFTVTPSVEDNHFLDEILSHAPKGALTFPCNLNQFAAALKGAVAYVGIDTAATHIAAALDTPTVALYGPTLTRYWAPWPNGCEEPSPFAANKGVQRKGLITIVQKDWECVPCNEEFCKISNRGKMECLEAISPVEVLQEIKNLLN